MLVILVNASNTRLGFRINTRRMYAQLPLQQRRPDVDHSDTSTADTWLQLCYRYGPIEMHDSLTTAYSITTRSSNVPEYVPILLIDPSIKFERIQMTNGKTYLFMKLLFHTQDNAHTQQKQMHNLKCVR